MPPRTRLSSSGSRTRLPTTTTRTRLTPAGRTRAVAAATEQQAHPHRSFFGGLVHDVTHPGIAELPFTGPLAATYLPFYLLGHKKKGVARTVGHVGQALLDSPYMMAGHPKATLKNLKDYPTSAAEGVQALAVTPLENAIRGSLPPMMGGARPRSRTGLAPALPAPVEAVGGFTTRLQHEGAKSGKELLKATIKDYKKRYGENWKVEAAKNPTYNFADAMTIVGAAVPMAAGARAFTALTRAGELESFGGRAFSELSAIEKAKAIKMEYHEPGLAEAGVPKTRRISYKPPVGERVYADQPYARGPLRRGAQVVGDALSEAFPNAKVVGAKGRVTKANAIKNARDLERVFGSVPGLDSFAKLSPDLATRLTLEGQLVNRPAHLMGEAAKTADAAEHAAHDAHVSGELSKLHDILSKDEYTLEPGSVRSAQTDAFKQQRLDEIKRAINATPNKHYHRAYEAATYISNLNRHIHLDEAGFTAHANDLKRTQDRIRQYEALDAAGKLDRPEKLAQARDDAARIQRSLEDAISGTADVLDQRQGLVRRYVDANRPDTEPPERANLIAQARARGIPEEQIHAAVTAFDARALAHPGGVEDFWTNRVGTSGDGALKYIASRPDKTLYQNFPEFGETSLIEGDPLNPPETSAYYSKAQKNLADAPWSKRGTMQKEQLQAWFQDPKNVNPDEYANANMDLFFDQYPDGIPISKADLHEHLSTPLNQYNIREEHRLNLQEAHEAGYGTEYDHRFEYGDGEVSDQLSRIPAPGEYHEIIMSLPDHEVGPWYSGKGGDHWQTNDVVGHVRFQEFEEGGVRKLVVEEIQSDWGSDFRKGDTGMRPPKNQRRWNELAVDRILRHAGENEIDQVIFPEANVLHARNAAGDFLDPEARMQAWDSLDLFGKSPEQSRPLIQQVVGEGETSFQRLYEGDHPQAAAKRLGVEGKVVNDAYEGHFSPMGGRSEAGPIKGTVFELDDAARARARTPSALYQRQPDWLKLPKGATEFLGDSKTRIHLFENADLSTMMHELFHISMPDLEPEHRKVLEQHYGGGKPMDEWGEAAHENAARDFERWLRSGASPNRLVAAAFQRIGEWMRELFGKMKEENTPLPKDVQAAFDSIFKEHRTAPDAIPDFYVPHRSRIADITGTSTSRGIPRANRDIGDYVPAREPPYKRNDLRLLRSGLINFDPRLMIDHMNRLVMLQRSNNIREFLLQHAEPLLPGTPPDLENNYVIKKAGTSVDKPLFDALEGVEDPQGMRQTMKQHADDYLTDDQAKVDLWKDEESRRLGSGRARQLYQIDKGFVNDLMVQLTGKTPGAATRNRGAGALALADAALDTQRAILLYGNPGYYTANALGNAFMLSMSDPRAWRSFRWAFQNGTKEALGTGGADHRWRRIAQEMGRGRTTGPLSQHDLFFENSSFGRFFKPRRGESRAELGGKAVSRAWHAVGSHAGAIVDDTFRTMAWKQSARKRGIKTDEQIDKLLNDAVQRDDMAAREAAQKKLHAIRDEAEQLMLDFDSMSSFEKSWLTRFIFLYPFLRASVKYPFIFGGERPLTTAALMQSGRIGQTAAEDVLGPRPEGLPQWAGNYARMFGGYLPIGSMAPTQPLSDIAQSFLYAGRPGPVGVNQPWEYLNPLTQLIGDISRSQNRYGRDAPAWSIAQTEAGLPGWMAQALHLRQPSPLYKDRSFWDTLMRSTRVVPFQIDENYGQNG